MLHNNKTAVVFRKSYTRKKKGVIIKYFPLDCFYSRIYAPFLSNLQII